MIFYRDKLARRANQWRAQNLSSPRAKNISLNMSGKSALPVRPVPTRQEGRIARRHERGMGCGGRSSRRRASLFAGRLAVSEQQACKTTARAAYGKTVWSWHPLLMSAAGGKFDPAGSKRHQAGSDGDKNEFVAGEHGISRQTIAQGMPECFR
jgi:hypothetical protein